MEEKSLSATIKETIKKYLKWYSYPVVYFLATSLVCAYAWYTRPIAHRAGIKVAFKTIALIPTLIWIGVTTVWVALAIVLYASIFLLRNRLPELSIWRKAERTSQSRGDSIKSSDKQSELSLWRKTLNISFSVLGIVFVVSGCGRRSKGTEYGGGGCQL